MFVEMYTNSYKITYIPEVKPQKRHKFLNTDLQNISKLGQLKQNTKSPTKSVSQHTNIL